MATADHGKGFGAVKRRSAGNQRHRLLARVDEITKKSATTSPQKTAKLTDRLHPRSDTVPTSKSAIRLDTPKKRLTMPNSPFSD